MSSKEDVQDLLNEIYCLCKSDLSDNLIECEGPECIVKFYHPKCVGLKDEIDDGPSDWFCNACLGIEQPVLPQVIGKKKEVDSQKTTVDRQELRLREVKGNARKFFFSTLTKLQSENICNLNKQFKDLICTILDKLSSINSQAIDSYCEEMVEIIWKAVTAGENSKGLLSVKLEKKASLFHNLRTSDTLKQCYQNFIIHLGIDRNPVQVILSQFLFQRLFHELLMFHNANSSSVTMAKKTTSVKLSKTEENVLRYSSGYICRKILQHYKRYQLSEISSECTAILQTFHTSETDINTSNVLTFTKEWIKLVNRGGLFTVTDEVYTFFKEMELLVKSNLSDHTQYHQINKLEMEEKIHNNEDINARFEDLMKNTDNDDIKTSLFKKFVSCWVNLRLKAFSNLLMFVKKQEDSRLSRRCEKSMRRELNKEQSNR